MRTSTFPRLHSLAQGLQTNRRVVCVFVVPLPLCSNTDKPCAEKGKEQERVRGGREREGEGEGGRGEGERERERERERGGGGEGDASLFSPSPGNSFKLSSIACIPSKGFV